MGRTTIYALAALFAAQATAETTLKSSTSIPPKQVTPGAACMTAKGGPAEDGVYDSYTREQAQRCPKFDLFDGATKCAEDSCCKEGPKYDELSEVDSPSSKTAVSKCTDQINTKENLYNFEAWEGQKNCAVTGMKPREPRSLSFCHKFNEKACCAPVMDDENTAMFNMLTGVGLSCRIRGDIREDPLAQWYCMNCDPEQPSYVRAAPHDPLDRADGDASPSEGRDSTLLVCEDWAVSSFGADPILEGPNGRFDLCGLLKSSPCLDANEVPIPDRDPYTCGDDLVIPSSFIVTKDDGTLLVRESLEAFMNVDSMGPPLLNEDFYFKVVPRYNCNETELVDMYKRLEPGALPQPVCLRTKAQLITTKYNFGAADVDDVTFQQYFCKIQGEDCDAIAKADKTCSDKDVHMANPCCCAPWIEERCFDSAMSVTSSVAVLMASVAAYVMF